MAEELYNGIAIIIDDVLKNYSDYDEYKISGEERKDDIFNIIEKIKEKNLPFLTFNDRPTKEIIENFTNISFILLDWKLYKEESNAILDRINTNANVGFIKQVIEKCFVPIFIFSNEEPVDIIEKLRENNLYYEEDESNFIFIKKKEELIAENGLFKLIDAWIHNHPTVYLMKKWDRSFSKAKNESFWHLYNRSPIWPKILTASFKDDKVNIEENLNDVLFRIIKARTKLKEFDTKILEKSVAKFDRKEVSEVIRGITFIESDYLESNNLKLGDIFKKNGKYYYNIRPECDTVIERESFDDEIYLIKGRELTSGQKFKVLEKHYDADLGFLEIHNEAFVLGLDNKDIVCFKFNKIYKEIASKFLDKRICRLLPPYSVYVQQKFISYMGRIGIPRYPDEIIQMMKNEIEKGKNKEGENEKNKS